MSEVEYKKGYTSIHTTLAQDKLGAIDVDTLFYAHSQETYNQVIKVYHEIEGATGWGKKIFEGTLEDLINLIEKAQP